MESNVETDVEVLAAGYVRASESLHNMPPDSTWDPEADPDQRAYEIVRHTIHAGPPQRAWALARAIIDAAPDDGLDGFAAGPLEDCIRIHGASIVDEIERAAAGDERFRWALGVIWLSASDLPDAVLRRIVRASDEEVKVLGWPPDSDGGSLSTSRAP